MKKLSHERLKEVLIYDPKTGIFTRRIRTSHCLAGSIAGCLTKEGYITLSIDAVDYYAHRLAWFYTHGTYPKNSIDHRDGNRSNNRMANLRDATHLMNMQNQYKPQKNNMTGFRGVSYERNRFRAKIQVNGKGKYLGTYLTAEAAYDAYIEAKCKLHPECIRHR